MMCVWLCCTDIAVIVFNKCMSDNNGKTLQLDEGGTEVVTQDSEKFEVTFNYEFLEDFCEKKTHGVHIRSTNSRRQKFQSEGGDHNWSPDTQALTEGDEIDGGLIQSALRRVVNAPDPNMENNWGPEGFTKNHHPLNIMVCMYL